MMRLRVLLCAAFLWCCQSGCPARAEAGAGSVLGLEPGSRRLCNDDLGVTLWGPDATPTLSVGKSDVWDRRNPQPPEPVLTLARIMEMARAGDKRILNGAGWYSAYGAHDFPCPKPVGQIILQLDFLKPDGVLSVEQQPRQIQLTASNGAKQLKVRIFVSAVRNIIIMKGEGAALDKGDVKVRLYRHRDTILPGGEVHPTLGDRKSPEDFEALPMPTSGSGADALWIAQDFGKDPTFPDGFTGVLTARIAGTPVVCDTVADRTGLGTPMVTEKEGRISHGLTKRFTPINEAPGSAVTAELGSISGPFTVYATVTTTQDDADPLARAQRDLEQAAKEGEATLWQEHEKQLDAYDARPHARAWSADGQLKVDSLWGGVPYRVRPFGYYGDVPLCSVDSTKFCFQDSSMWHADFHFNEIEATGPCMLRQFDTLDSYFSMIRALLPMAQANARAVYGCAGAMYPLVHYPIKADSIIHTHISWEQGMEISALLAKPFWLRFQYTWDLAFLRDSAYPVLREGARFYADFLKPGEDGVYHVFPTVSPEHRGITKDLEFNHDSQSALTLIRYHLRAAAQAATLLNTDGAEAAHWRDVAAHMPAYPTVDTPEGPIFIDVAGAQPMEYNIPVPLSAVFWGDDVGLDSPPEQFELARRTLRLINVWEPHRGYLKGVRRRLGLWEPGDGMALENLVQSHTGKIHVFPVVPDDFEGGFENIGAQGGFVVAATRTKAGVQPVTVISLAGNPCILANPWPGKSIEAIDMKSGASVPLVVDDRTVRFDTAPDHTYRVNAGQVQR